MTDERKAQYREAQRKRRERLKATGNKAFTIEISPLAQERLKSLSLAMYGSPSQPSKVIEHLLLNAQMTTSTNDVHEATSTLEDVKQEESRSSFGKALDEVNKREAEWHKGWKDRLGVDNRAWQGAKTNKDRVEMAKAAHKRAAMKLHPDRGGSADLFGELTMIYEAVKKGPILPKAPNGWAGFIEVKK